MSWEYIELGQKFQYHSSLINSVSILREHDAIIVTDAANNIVAKIGFDGAVLKTFGAFRAGHGKSYLKEPVGAFVCGDFIVVSDWHNHRIIILDDNLDYLSEYGILGDIGDNDRFMRFLRFIRRLSNRGSYISAHFHGETGPTRHPGHSIITFALSCFDIVLSYKSIRNICIAFWSNSRRINKANGACLLKKQIIITQKNNRCLSVYDISKNELKSKFHMRKACNLPFGRLGQCFDFAGNVAVCDPDNASVFIFDSNLEMSYVLTNIELSLHPDDWFPFCGCRLDHQHMAVGGKDSVHIVDINAKKIVHTFHALGEVHGLDFCNRRNKILVADRYHGRLIILPNPV